MPEKLTGSYELRSSASVHNSENMTLLSRDSAAHEISKIAGTSRRQFLTYIGLAAGASMAAYSTVDFVRECAITDPIHQTLNELYPIPIKNDSDLATPAHLEELRTLRDNRQLLEQREASFASLYGAPRFQSQIRGYTDLAGFAGGLLLSGYSALQLLARRKRP